MKVTVYTRDGCPSCTLVKSYLRTIDVPFDVVEINDKPDREAWYDKEGLAGPRRVMPKILVDYEGGNSPVMLHGYEKTVAYGLAARFRRAQQQKQAA